MDKDIVLEKIRQAAVLLYQNKEQDGITAVSDLLQVFQKMIQNLTEEQMKNCGNFTLLMMREILEAYQCQDIMGMADCLTEKATLFVQYVSGK